MLGQDMGEDREGFGGGFIRYSISTEHEKPAAQGGGGKKKQVESRHGQIQSPPLEKEKKLTGSQGRRKGRKTPLTGEWEERSRSGSDWDGGETPRGGHGLCFLKKSGLQREPHKKQPKKRKNQPSTHKKPPNKKDLEED